MVPYAAAYKIWKKFNVSVKWLVTGAGKTLDLSPLPDPQALKLRPRARLSDAFDYWLTKEVSRMDPFYGFDVPMKNARLMVFKALIEEADKWLAMVPDDELRAFVEALQSRAEEVINSYGYQPENVIWERGLELERAWNKSPELWLLDQVPSGVKDSQRKQLTEPASVAKLAPVKSQLDNLLADLNRLTREQGKKTELAEFLGAPLASVSRWLAGEREPGGKTTLQMLRWVGQQERQQESPGRADTRPEPKTQVRKSDHEKQTQVPKKR
jgi:hypothetical protein